MSAPAWTGVGRCVGCDHENIEVHASREHGERVLCRSCAERPYVMPTATALNAPPVSSNDRQTAAPSTAEPQPTNGATPAPATSIEQRLADTRVDLLALIEGGIPERAWLPRSERMLARGARHHVSARMKEGKSLAFLTHSVDMAAAGARVVILDRENGSDEYARRLGHVLEDRPAAAREAARERLAYFAFPLVKLTDGAALAAALAGTDLVILDSTRTFLSSLALDEDSSDDFAKFATAIIEPLFRAGIATVQLDNTGHGDTSRARGSSTKGDLADVLYSLKTTERFDEHHRGGLLLTRSHSRFGDIAASHSIELGAGHFGTFNTHGAEPTATAAADTFRPTGLMERVSRLIEETPGLSKRAILAAISSKDGYVTLALELLIADGYVRIEVAGQTHRHHLIRPYNEAEDPHRGPVAQPWPNRGPDTGEEDRGPVAPPKGTRDTGHGVEDTATVALVTDDEQDAYERALALVSDRVPVETKSRRKATS